MLRPACLCVAGLALSSAALADVTYLGALAFPTNVTDRSGLTDPVAGMPQNLLGSLGSGLAYTGQGDEYLMVCDRGPLGEGSYRARFHVVQLPLTEDGEPAAAPKVAKTVLLSDDAGRPLVGDPAAIDSASPAAGTRLDPEAIRPGPDGTVYIADEYGPSVLAFSAEGKLLKRLPVPEKFRCAKPSAKHDQELPPLSTSGRLPNGGFEGLAVTPSGDKLYAIMQGPLLQDGALEGGKAAGVNVRILEFTPASGQTRELLYQVDAPGISCTEILAVNDHEFLVLERDAKAGEEAAHKRVVKVDISGASDISGIAALPATGTPEGVKPVAKSVFLDLLGRKVRIDRETLPEKIEGLTFGPALPDGRRTLLISTDNDFKGDEGTYVYIFGFDAKDLPGLAPAKP